MVQIFCLEADSNADVDADIAADSASPRTRWRVRIVAISSIAAAVVMNRSRRGCSINGGCHTMIVSHRESSGGMHCSGGSSAGTNQLSVWYMNHLLAVVLRLGMLLVFAPLRKRCATD